MKREQSSAYGRPISGPSEPWQLAYQQSSPPHTPCWVSKSHFVAGGARGPCLGAAPSSWGCPALVAGPEAAPGRAGELRVFAQSPAVFALCAAAWCHRLLPRHRVLSCTTAPSRAQLSPSCAPQAQQLPPGSPPALPPPVPAPQGGQAQSPASSAGRGRAGRALAGTAEPGSPPR